MSSFADKIAKEKKSIEKELDRLRRLSTKLKEDTRKIEKKILDNYLHHSYLDTSLRVGFYANYACQCGKYFEGLDEFRKHAVNCEMSPQGEKHEDNL